MKKLLTAILAATLMTSCIKMPEVEPNLVQPGLVMYNALSTQNNYSMIPVDLAIKLNLLISEAEKQGVDDLENVTVTRNNFTINVKDDLFYSSGLNISHENGTYTLTFRNSYYRGLLLDGKVVIDTYGKTMDELSGDDGWGVAVQGNTWSEFRMFDEQSQDFYHTIASSTSHSIAAGTQPGSWDITVIGSIVNYHDANGGSLEGSSWTCVNTLSLAGGTDMSYSGAYNSDFKFDGKSYGKIMSGVSMEYVIDSPLTYVTSCSISGWIVLSGKVTCSFTNYEEEINQTEYPASSTTREWTRNEANGCLARIKVTYNGESAEYSNQ